MVGWPPVSWGGSTLEMSRRPVYRSSSQGRVPTYPVVFIILGTSLKTDIDFNKGTRISFVK